MTKIKYQLVDRSYADMKIRELQVIGAVADEVVCDGDAQKVRAYKWLDEEEYDLIRNIIRRC